MESSNNIIHPTRPKGRGLGRSCFGRVMMSVIRIQKAVNQELRLVLGGSTIDG
jgi:hypothetical protein